MANRRMYVSDQVINIYSLLVRAREYSTSELSVILVVTSGLEVVTVSFNANLRENTGPS